MTIQEVISKFNTTPFLFAGSGITRRYYGLPDWKELLKHFAMLIHNDRFSYNLYESQAKGALPLTATLIQKDFDDEWFRNPSIRTLDEQGLKSVEGGKSPFKLEVAAYLRQRSVPVSKYVDEMNKLKSLSRRGKSVRCDYHQL